MTTDSLPGAGAGAGHPCSHVPTQGTSHPGAISHATGFRAKIGLASVARRTLGISMLMMTVFLWTASNFLASFIFSDNTYSKPFFVVYLNTSIFAVTLVPMSLHFLHAHGTRSTRLALQQLLSDLAQDVRDKVAMLRLQERKDATRKLLGSGDGNDDEVYHDDDEPAESAVFRRRHRSASGARLLGDETGAVHDAHPAAPGDESKQGATATVSATGVSADRDAMAAERLLGDISGPSRGDSDDQGYDSAAAVLDLESGAEADAIPPGMTASMISATGSHYPLFEKLSVRETVWLSLEFCMLWFSANYLAVACLEYTSVASATIFTSLSSMFTLLFCAVWGVEGFTMRKFLGVVASVIGIALVSSIDLSGKSDENRGEFPHKTSGEIALGDSMALLSAVVYGAYVTVMKQRVGHEDRVSMPLFFGLVGLFNVLLLWPGFIILHLTGLETVWLIIVLNSLSSFASDLTWAYAMLLTTPLVVTVGLSLTIPLSLIGEMFQYNKYSSGLYWVGAGVVLMSFLFVNHESHEPDEAILEDET